MGSLTPPVDDHPSVSFGNAATKTLRRSQLEESAYLRVVDALPFLADHRELPAAAIDQFRQGSDSRITATCFDRGNRRLRHSRASREFTL